MTTTTKNARTWTDQPPHLEGAEVLASFTSRDGDGNPFQAEVRRVGETQARFLTIGNLFGSQTFCCAGADVVLMVLDRASKGINELPKGAAVVQ